MEFQYLSQENDFYNSQINKYGCYFLSLLMIAREHIPRMTIDHNDVQFFYEKLIKKGAMREDCYILDAVKALHAFGMNDVVTRARHRDWNYEFQSEDLTYVPAVIKLPRIGHHFILLKRDGPGLVKYWDSLFLKKNDYEFGDGLPLRVFSHGVY